MDRAVRVVERIRIAEPAGTPAMVVHFDRRSGAVGVDPAGGDVVENDTTIHYALVPTDRRVLDPAPARQ